MHVNIAREIGILVREQNWLCLKLYFNKSTHEKCDHMTVDNGVKLLYSCTIKLIGKDAIMGTSRARGVRGGI